MLYRFADAGTAAAIAADIARGARRPAARGAAEHRLLPAACGRPSRASIAPWVPFIIAFGVIALVDLGAHRGQRGQRRGDRRDHPDRRAEVDRLHPGPGGGLLRAAGRRCPRCSAASPGWSAGTCWRSRCSRQNAQVYEVGVLGVPFWVDVDRAAGRPGADRGRRGTARVAGRPDERGAGDRHRPGAAARARLPRAPGARQAHRRCRGRSRSGWRPRPPVRPGRW